MKLEFSRNTNYKAQRFIMKNCLKRYNKIYEEKTTSRSCDKKRRKAFIN